MPYFCSDLADWAAWSTSGPARGDEVIRGSLDDGKFTAFYLDDGAGEGGAAVGRSDDLDVARRFISEKTKVDESKLTDSETDLSSL